MPEVKNGNIVNVSGVSQLPPSPRVNAPGPVGGPVSFDDMFNKSYSGTAPSTARPSVPLSAIDTSGRYKSVLPYENTEEAFAQQQGDVNQFINGSLKAVGTFTSSFLGTTAGILTGISKWAAGGRRSDVVDNEVYQTADRIEKELENVLPNYETQAEQNAEWWSGTNLGSGNFWGNKFVKNLGFSYGAMLGGAAWSRVLSNLGKVTKLVKAGRALEAATAMESEIASIPLAQKPSAMSKFLDKAVQNYVKTPTSRIINNGDRIMTSVIGSAGEGSFESYQGMNRLRQELIDQYVGTHGRMPQGEEMERINSTAENAGSYILGANMLLLTATNFYQLPKILGSSRKVERALINDIEQKGISTAFAEAIPTGFKKGLSRVGNVAGLIFSPSEALEEGSQSAIEVGVNDFFQKQYRNKKDAQDFFSTLDGAMGSVFGKGVDDVFNTKAGLESILIGGLSGGLQQARSEIKERGVYGEGGKRATDTQIALSKDALNKSNINEQLQDQAKYAAIGIGSQKSRQNYLRNNDILNEKDAEHDYVMSYVLPRVKYGKEASIYQELEYYKEQAATEEGFQDLIDSGYANPNEKREQYLQRIQALEDVTRSTEKIYSALNDKYSGLTLQDGKTRAYPPAVLEKMTYAASKISNYDQRIPELSGKLASHGVVVTPIVEQVYESGKTDTNLVKNAVKDLNKLEVKGLLPQEITDLKTVLSDVVDLALRRKAFADEYGKIAKNPANYADTTPLTVEDTISPEAKVRQLIPSEKEGEKAKSVVKDIEIGKDYSLKQPFLREGDKLSLAPKLQVMSTTLGGEYEVKLPTGEISFMKPADFKKYELSEIDNASPRVAELLNDAIAKVSRQAKFRNLGIAQAKDKLAHVNSLNNKELTDAVEAVFQTEYDKYVDEMAKSEYKRRKLIEQSGSLETGQQELENNGLNTGEDIDESLDPDAARKTLEALFTSITLPSGLSKAKIDKAQLPQFVHRYNEFINNLKNFKNESAIKIILVPGLHEGSYGLKGLANIAFEKEALEELPSENYTDINNGIISAVFVEQDGQDLYYVDKAGNRIKNAAGKDIKVGESAADSLSQVVFATMPTTELTWRDGITPRYRVQDSDEKERYQSAWRELREDMITKPSSDITAYGFGVSRGFPVTIPGVTQKNKIGEVLNVSDDVIAQTPGMIQVSTTGGITHKDGNTYKFAKGRPVLVFGDVLEHLQNSQFSQKQAKTIFEVLKKMSEVIQGDIAADKGIKLKNRYTDFLTSVLYWKKSQAPSKNQIFLDETTGKINIGTKSFDLIDVAESEKDIIDALRDANFNVNNSKLTEGGEFYEFSFEDGQLVEREWPNYQAFLLSSKNPDGSARETPLTINVSVPTAAVPYAYEQKYATLSMALKLPAPKAKGPEIILEKPASKEDPQTIIKTVLADLINDKVSARIESGEELDLTGKTVYEFPTKHGRVDYIIKEDGVQIVPGETITNMASNIDVLNQYRQALGLQPIEAMVSLGGEDVTVTEEETPIEEAIEPEEEQKPIEIKKGMLGGAKNSFGNFRKAAGTDTSSRMTAQDEEFFKSWVATNLPKLDYTYLNNMIKVVGGGEAWGKLANGAIQIVRGGLKGTEYHEAYEYVEKAFLSPEDVNALNTEFRAKTGTFLDRESGKRFEYSDPAVTDYMIKERRADDFSEFMLGKLPARTLSEKVGKFFKSIIDFVKDLFTKPSLQDKLFKDITSAKFANAPVNAERLYASEEYKKVEGIPADFVYEIVDDMTARFYQGLYSTNADLFNLEEKNANSIFNVIVQDYKDSGLEFTDAQFKDLVATTKEKLISQNIEFNEDNIVTINDEGANNRDYAADAFTVNFKKSAHYAIKLLSGSLVRTSGQVSKNPMDMPEYAPSANLGGMQLIPMGEVYVTLTNKLSNIKEVDNIVASLYELATENPDYVQLFRRLKGNMSTGQIDFNSYTDSDYRLLTSFVQTYTKQSPDIIFQYVRDGKRYSGLAAFSKAAQFVENKFITGIIAASSAPTSLIKYKNKQYVINPDATLTQPTTKEQQMSLLKGLGIEFDNKSYSRLSKEQKVEFGEAVQQVYTDVTSDNVLKISRDASGLERTIGGGLIKLAQLYASVNTFNYDSSTSTAEGKRQQIYTDSNAPAMFEYYFNSVKTLDDLKSKFPAYNDVFSTNSLMFKLGGTFFDKQGNRTKTKINVAVINGEIDVNKDKGKSMSKLNPASRMLTEMNQNAKGNYYILIPADSSTEWMLVMGNPISFKDFATGRSSNKVAEIFTGYLKDEILLIKDAPNRSYLANMKGREKQLRFFDDYLKGTPMHSNIMKRINDNESIETINKYIDEHSAEIGEIIEGRVRQISNETFENLKELGEIKIVSEDKYSFLGIDSNFAGNKNVNFNRKSASKEEIMSMLDFLNTNYTINNIEMYKSLFGDPNQFKTSKKGNKITLDITKRIKSFLSPRRVTINYDQLNANLNKKYNTVDGTKLKKGDPGYHLHKNFARTVTLSDISVVGSLYGDVGGEMVNEADAASWINPVTFREVKQKNGQWSDLADDFHEWHMAYTRQKMSQKGAYDYKKNTALAAHDAALISKPIPEYVVEELKPIASGFKANKNYIDLVLDKFSQMPLYYHAVEGTALEGVVSKMLLEDIDYYVVESGRKAGTQVKHDLYTGGKLNTAKIDPAAIVDVPWDAYGIQVENTYNGDSGQRLASQATKVVTVDLYENGKPIHANSEELVEKHTKALTDLYNEGFDSILNDLGIVDKGDRYDIVDKEIVAKTLRAELLKRELSNNALQTVTINPATEDFDVPFEASTNYIDIKRILYSMVDSRITSRKVNGVSAVQVPVTGFESGNRKMAIKEEEGYKEISQSEFDKLSKEEKAKVVLTSDTLKFYEDANGKRYAEIMIALPKSMKALFKGKSEEQILKELNDNLPQALAAIGFRIPTQAISSIENIRIKKLLPAYMGKTVVVPSEITTKAGSDFDIDKLNIYLRSFYRNAEGKLELFKSHGTKEETLAYYDSVFDSIIDTKQKALVDQLFATSYSEYVDADYEMSLSDKISKLDEKRSEKDVWVRDAYRRALENNYYDAIEDIMSQDYNFDRVTATNTVADISKIADDIDIYNGVDESTIPNRTLDRNFMSALRHAFLSGKAWVGIVAVNITGHSNAQKAGLYVDDANYKLTLPHNELNGKVSLSGVKTSDDKYISDTLSQFANAVVDIAKDPFIMKIIYSPQIVSLMMYFVRAGVSARHAALFLQQPIVKKLVTDLDNANQNINKIFTSKTLVNDLMNEFPTTAVARQAVQGEYKVGNLEQNIRDYAKGELNDEQNAEQQLIFLEFKNSLAAANGLSVVTQSTNYDTVKIRSAEQLSKIQSKTQRESIIKDPTVMKISSAQAVLDNTHIGPLERVLDNVTDALGTLLKFNNIGFRELINDMLKYYQDNKYLGADNYNKVSEKLSASLLDYIVLSNNEIDAKDLTTGPNSAAEALKAAKAKYLTNQLLKDLDVVVGKRKDSPTTIKLNASLDTAAEVDIYTDMMRNLRDNPDTTDLYDKLVKLSLLQGTYKTSASIKEIVPIEDYSEYTTAAVKNVMASDRMSAFKDFALFQRNNFLDTTIVPQVMPKGFADEKNFDIDPETGDVFYKYNFPALVTGQKHKLITLSRATPGAGADLITIPRVVLVDGVRVDFSTGYQISDRQFAIAAKNDDNVFNYTYGYQLVKNNLGKALVIPGKNGKPDQFIYTLVNLYGDGKYTSEYPTLPVQTQLKNGTVGITQEMTFDEVYSVMTGQPMETIKTEVVAGTPTEPAEEENTSTPSDNESIIVPGTTPDITWDPFAPEVKTKPEVKSSKTEQIGDTTIFYGDDDTFDVQDKEEGIIADYVRTIEEARQIARDNEASKQKTASNQFSYEGTIIDTDFQLTEGQDVALKGLVDFVKSPKTEAITLQGPAGTGKTAVIGYLQKYFGNSVKMIYSAPTHAATVQLAFSTVRVGNKDLPMTVASMLNRKTGKFTSKILKMLGLMNNVIVVDEASMLSKDSYQSLLSAAKDKGVKVIFMGDPNQIPEVDSSNPSKKQISLAFIDQPQLALTEIKRTANNGILKVLSAMRKLINEKIPKIANSDTLKYLNVTSFNRLLGETVLAEPEDSILISYTNKGASEYNAKIRSLLGREGELQKDDVLVGYLGYASKQITSQSIANSVQYTITSIKKNGSVYNITATSKKLKALEELKVKGVKEEAYTSYMQLSNNDVFTFEDITVKDMESNNAYLSSMFNRLYRAKQAALANPKLWVNYFMEEQDVSKSLSNADLGDNYIYNPASNRMERFDPMKHGDLKRSNPELYIEKGIDFGHAVTIHKAQGATYKNVFFDANSLPKGSVSRLYKGDTLVGSEKHSLAYVGMSRASNNLTVSDDIPDNFYNLVSDESISEPKGDTMVLNGKSYSVSEIDVPMLEKLGYDIDTIVDIMNEINGCK